MLRPGPGWDGIPEGPVEPAQARRLVLEAIDLEQRRIARDLHDGLGQHLTGLAFMAAAIRQSLAAQNHPQAATADALADVVNTTVSEVRKLVRGLVPPVLQDRGLVPALEHLAADVLRLFRADCRFDPGPCAAATASLLHRALSPDEATHLYRMAQEGVSNAIRHAAATRIDLSIRATDAGLEMTVTDDGRGLPQRAAQRPGLGLKTIAYRASQVGAVLTIGRAAPESSNPGTRVTCRLTFGDRAEEVAGVAGAAGLHAGHE